MTTISVGVGIAEPTHDISLSDGVNTLAFVTSDASGIPSKRSLRRFPQERMALKTVGTGLSRWGDAKPPYASLVQEDWSSGRGGIEYDRNTAKFYDAIGMQPASNGGIMPFGNLHIATGYANVVQAGEYPLYTQAVTTGPYIVLSKLTVTAAVTYKQLWVGAFRRRACTAKLVIYNDAGGGFTPGTLNTTVSVTIGPSPMVYAPISAALAAGVYWVGINFDNADAGTVNDPYLYWSVQGNYAYSTNNGSSFTQTNGYAAPWVVLSDAAPMSCKFFEYRNLLWMATNPDDGTAGKLHLNGTIGAADSNSGDKTKTIDATASWAGNQWANATAIILGGTGLADQVNYRSVLSNSTTTLNHSTAWQSAHQETGVDATTYGITGTGIWTSDTLGVTVPTTGFTDAEVCDDIIYLAQGERKSGLRPVIRAKWYNNQGTGTFLRSYDTCQATFVKRIRDQYGNNLLWLAQNEDISGFPRLTKAPVPRWGENLNESVPVVPLVQFDEINPYPTGITVGIDTNNSIINVADAFTTGLMQTKSLSAFDLRFATGIKMKVFCTVDLQEGDVEFLVDDTAKCASPILRLSLPQIKANTWLDIDLPINNAVGTLGLNAVISVGFNLTSDRGAMVFYFTNIVAYKIGKTIQVGDINDRITGLERYGDPETCWVFKEGEFGEIVNDVYHPVSVREMESIKSPDNGRVHWVRDVYLQFGMGRKVERYYRQSIEDIGPDKEIGVYGKAVAAYPYPGADFVAYSGGKTTSKPSQVMMNSGSGWFPVYSGYDVRTIHVQAVPGETFQRLWINDNGVLFWMNVYLTPEQYLTATNDTFLPSYSYESGWYYGGLKEVTKLFKQARVFIETISANVYLRYTTDGITWIYSAPQTASADGVLDFTFGTLGLNAKKVKIELVVLGDAIVRAVVLEAVAYMQPKNGYQFQFGLKNGDYAVNLTGDEDDVYSSIASVISRLETWAGSATPLTMRSNFTAFDQKTVFLDPVTLLPLAIVTDEGAESYLVQITASDV